MDTRLLVAFQLSYEVSSALQDRLPLVALESTVITHGLPYPQNLQIAEEMENQVRVKGAVPATIAILNGRVHIGISAQQRERLAQADDMHKISNRDFGPAIIHGWSGGTTVAGTLLAAHRAGIRAFATGGIGGVHRQAPFDVSADLPMLARTPVIVVCAGAKAILDLPATHEYLETAGIPVLGYETDEFPAFYARRSGLPVSARVDSVREIVAIARTHWDIGQQGGILVVQPPPEEAALDENTVELCIKKALEEAQNDGIHGQAVTPFLLRRVAELTGGSSIKANLALLRNNASLAAEIAVEFARIERTVSV